MEAKKKAGASVLRSPALRVERNAGEPSWSLVTDTDTALMTMLYVTDEPPRLFTEVTDNTEPRVQPAEIVVDGRSVGREYRGAVGFKIRSGLLTSHFRCRLCRFFTSKVITEGNHRRSEAALDYAKAFIVAGESRYFGIWGALSNPVNRFVDFIEENSASA